MAAKTPVKTPVKRIASKGSGTPVAKKSVAKKPAVKTVAKPPTKKAAAKTVVAEKKIAKKVNPKTGFWAGTDQDIIALELLKGGTSRPEVVQRLKGLLAPTTASGTTKPVANLVAGVMRVLREKGFEEVGTYKVRPPKKS